MVDVEPGGFSPFSRSAVRQCALGQWSAGVWKVTISEGTNLLYEKRIWKSESEILCFVLHGRSLGSPQPAHRLDHVNLLEAPSDEHNLLQLTSQSHRYEAHCLLDNRYPVPCSHRSRCCLRCRIKSAVSSVSSQWPPRRLLHSRSSARTRLATPGTPNYLTLALQSIPEIRPNI